MYTHQFIGLLSDGISGVNMNELKNNFLTVRQWLQTSQDFQSIFDDVAIFGDDLFFNFVDLYGYRYIRIPYYENGVTEIRGIIKRAFNRWKYKYTGLLKTEQFEYNPIENYAMTETENATRTPDITQTETVKKTGTTDTTENRTIGTTGENSNTQTGTETVANDITLNRNVTTFDDTNYRNDTQDVTDGTQTRTPNLSTVDKMKTNETDNNTTQNTIDTTDTSNRTETGTETNTRSLTRSGNIGVTTSQQMIQSERELLNFSAMNEFLFGISIIICLDVVE